jgi:hypothetical protein
MAFDDIRFPPAILRRFARPEESLAQSGPHPPFGHLLPSACRERAKATIPIAFSRGSWVTGEGGQRPDEGLLPQKQNQQDNSP